MYKIEKRLISVMFHLGFERNHHNEYCDKVNKYLITIIDKSISSDDQSKAYDEVVELLDDSLYYNDPQSMPPRSKESLINEFEERASDFIDRYNNGQLIGYIWSE